MLRHGRWHSAVYLGGYALECSLKAIVCLSKGFTVLPPEYETHDLRRLLDSTGLRGEVERTPALSSAFERLVNLWQTQMRYHGKPYGRQEAKIFFDAVGRLSSWLERKAL